MEAWRHRGVEVWPNPASGVLSVKVLGLIEGIDYDLVVYDIIGNEVLVTGYSSPCELNISFLATGIYLAVVKMEREVIGSRKFIIER
jgi:hypothetical protein